jgi:SAM-dependent methyltransferase
MTRVCEPEELDSAPAEVAALNLADMARINYLTGARHHLLSLLTRQAFTRQAFRFLDVGAASGDFARAVSHRFPQAATLCLDLRRRNLAAAPGQRLQADAFHLPLASHSCDVVHSSLFLHHFSPAQCAALLREMARVARHLVLVQDLHRHPIPYWFLSLTRPLLRWHPITVADGQRSVAAGWRRSELQQILAQAQLSGHIHWHFPSFRYFIAITPR